MCREPIRISEFKKHEKSFRKEKSKNIDHTKKNPRFYDLRISCNTIGCHFTDCFLELQERPHRPAEVEEDYEVDAEPE
jgi:hypothetical protein